MLNLLAMNAGTATLLVRLSIPLIPRWIDSNAWRGFRVKTTLNNRDAWHAVNAYAGWRLLAGGLSGIVAAVGFCFVPNLTLLQYSLGCLVTTGIVLMAGLAQTGAYLRGLCR